ncbi:Alpha/beta hydrolase family-domain-containing protein [Podospora didyma]|uniref:Alpha/beta hydrolase family-domain-containing protein n=1 Tax=Podospora didyma TaxID=330526 RepID=A0AAE0N257_9PEZI|nr:Alpha/beta hydrolase family-domain-containing protein [Podospora didyma]
MARSNVKGLEAAMRTVMFCDTYPMYVRTPTLEKVVSPVPIVFLHGDHHNGAMWLTKPDGGPGWAEYFWTRGFAIYVPDLPFTAPESLPGNYKEGAEQLPQAMQHTIHVTDIQNYFTASERVEKPEWPSAKAHTQWPGSGVRPDPIFARYAMNYVCRSTFLDPRERQTAGQDALRDLLEKIGRPCILIGHGSGANMAWLAADASPKLVAAIIAVEPIMPFTGHSVGLKKSPDDIRPYGISDIPMNFDPPPVAPSSTLDLVQASIYLTDHEPIPRYRPIPYRAFLSEEYGKGRLLQDTTLEIGTVHRPALNPARQLPNLQGFPQAIVTAEASFHSETDWATVDFLRQAGVKVEHLKLEKYNLRGNGHLCPLEMNSSLIADLLMQWIRNRIPPIDIAIRAAVTAQQAQLNAPQASIRSGHPTTSWPPASAANSRGPGLPPAGQIPREASTAAPSTPANANRHRSPTGNTAVSEGWTAVTPREQPTPTPVFHGAPRPDVEQRSLVPDNSVLPPPPIPSFGPSAMTPRPPAPPGPLNMGSLRIALESPVAAGQDSPLRQRRSATILRGPPPPPSRFSEASTRTSNPSVEPGPQQPLAESAIWNSANSTNDVRRTPWT